MELLRTEDKIKQKPHEIEIKIQDCQKKGIKGIS